jgi:hypothetical protein
MPPTASVPGFRPEEAVPGGRHGGGNARRAGVAWSGPGGGGGKGGRHGGAGTAGRLLEAVRETGRRREADREGGGPGGHGAAPGSCGLLGRGCSGRPAGKVKLRKGASSYVMAVRLVAECPESRGGFRAGGAGSGSGAKMGSGRLRRNVQFTSVSVRPLRFRPAFGPRPRPMVSVSSRGLRSVPSGSGPLSARAAPWAQVSSRGLRSVPSGSGPLSARGRSRAARSVLVGSDPFPQVPARFRLAAAPGRSGRFSWVQGRSHRFQATFGSGPLRGAPVSSRWLRVEPSG